VVELKILSKIEEAVGFGIKIQELFDLVVGTSTGGIVALGVFDKGWPLSHAIQTFRDLATTAFRCRRALRIPIYSSLAVPFCAFKYESAGIVEALKSSLGEDFLFGQAKGGSGATSLPCDQVKVGVVSCLDSRFQPCLLANYSRNPSGSEGKCLSAVEYLLVHIRAKIPKLANEGRKTISCSDRMSGIMTSVPGRRK
jgi:hypothetical protein